MKKLIICLLIAIGLSNCEVRVQQTQAQNSYKFPGTGYEAMYSYHTFDGMRYAILYTGSTYGGVTAINLTKDSVELAVLREQLKIYLTPDSLR